MIIDGDELDFTDSGEHLRRGMTVCRRLEPSLLDSLLCVGIGSAAHLLDHFRGSGVLSVTLPK
jgi:hypothetical protein